MNWLKFPRNVASFRTNSMFSEQTEWTEPNGRNETRKRNANSNEKKYPKILNFPSNKWIERERESERVGEMCTTQSTLSNNCDVDFISFHFIWSGSEGKCENQFISGLVFASVCTLDPLPNQSNKYLYKQIFSFRPVNVRAFSVSLFFCLSSVLLWLLLFNSKKLLENDETRRSKKKNASKYLK